VPGEGIAGALIKGQCAQTYVATRKTHLSGRLPTILQGRDDRFP
jgi:hypothetical protein